MKTPNEFRKFFDERLTPCLKELEESRKKVRSRVVLLHIVATCLMVVASVILIYIKFYGVLVFGLVIIGVRWIMLYVEMERKFVKDFKTKIIDLIVNFFENNFSYIDIPDEEERAGFAELVVQSKLFGEISVPEQVYVRDRILGNLGETRLNLLEIDVPKLRGTLTLFRGIFFVADFNKSFNGETIVLPDSMEKNLGPIANIIQDLNNSRGQLIKLEDTEFEKSFVVYGADQIEARYILSTSLMKRIQEFKNKADKDIRISFIKSKVFVAIPYEKNPFEPKLSQTLLDYNQTEKYFEVLQLAAGIVEDLNLNTKIWG